jgi:hypothetical protein
MKTTIIPKVKVFLMLALIIILCTLITWSAWTYLITQERTATIVETTGTVLYSAAGESQWKTAKLGMKLHKGDQLLTQAPDGTVIAVVDDGNFGFQMSPETLITYTARWNRLLDTGKDGIYLDQGEVIAETRDDTSPDKSRFSVETDTAQVVLEGSRTIVQKLKTEPTTRVSALEGEILVQPKSSDAKLIMPSENIRSEDEMLLYAEQTVIVYIQSTGVDREFESNLGQVIDAQTNKGVSGVLVQVVGKPDLFAITNQDGYFDIPGDSLLVELIIAGTTDKTAAELVLKPFTSQINQQILDATTLKGISHAKVVPINHPELAVETNPDGTFSLIGLPVGVHSLAVIADGYLSPVAEATVTPQGQGSISLIQLIPANSLNAFLPLVLNNYPYLVPAPTITPTFQYP